MDILRSLSTELTKNTLKKDNLRQLTTLGPLTKYEDIPKAAITYYPAITTSSKTQNYIGLLQQRKNQ
jgi:hypothetical protein